jgi:hypothetical protein
MKDLSRLCVFLLAVGWTACAGAMEPKFPLQVLYVGNAQAERANEFAEFLRTRFAQVDVANRKDFDPTSAHVADVVLLDWSQRDGELRSAVSPLGPRDGWSKPTVLLGSAGLFQSVCWEVVGGAG